MPEFIKDVQSFLIGDLHPAAMKFFLVMSAVGCVLCLTGGGMAYLKAVRSGGENSEFIWPIFSAIVLAIVIGLWPKIAGYNGWLYQLMDNLAAAVHQGVAGAYSEALKSFENGTWRLYNLLTNPVDTITGAFIFYLGLVGKLVIICAKFLQFFFIELEMAFAPLFLSLWSFQTTRSIAVNFIMSTIALFLWPLCWCLVDLGVWALAKFAVREMTASPAIGMQMMSCLAIYTVLGYIFAPLVIGRALKTGGGIGAAFAGSMIAGGMLAFNIGKAAAGLAMGNPAAAADGLKGVADTGKNAGAGQGNKTTPPPLSAAASGTEPLPATVPPPLPGKETAATGTATTVSANAANNGTDATVSAAPTPPPLPGQKNTAAVSTNTEAVNNSTAATVSASPTPPPLPGQKNTAAVSANTEAVNNGVAATVSVASTPPLGKETHTAASGNAAPFTPPPPGQETAAAVTGAATAVSPATTPTPSASAVSRNGQYPGMAPAESTPQLANAQYPGMGAPMPPSMPPLPLIPIVEPVMPAANMTPPAGARVTSTAHPNTRIGQTV